MIERKVKLFTGGKTGTARGGQYVTAADQLQAWLDECANDPDNAYDIGNPIVFNNIHLLVMYNVGPAAPPPPPPLCNVTCGSCGAAKKHYCRTCDAGVTVK